MLPETAGEMFCYACGTEPSRANKTGEWRFITPERVSKLSPCRRDCLLCGEIPRWMEAVKQKRWEEAWQIMRRYNPFPALTGYVCFHPCTENCNREQLDQALGIQEVERALGLWRLDNYRPPRKPKAVKDHVAVVGSGPAGLSCAYYLSEAGYRVTVFERAKRAGGMLALGIPEYRLPRRVLDKELAVLKEEGIRFVTGRALGTDFSLEELYDEFAQVFLATGAWISRESALSGSDCRDVYHALDFLSLVNTGYPPQLRDPVMVIGGGNAAIDSARTALRLDGVNHVSLVYRRGRVEMPAEQAEVEAAENEGVELTFNALPCEIETAGQCAKSMVFNHSRTGRDGLIVDRDSSFRKSCGTIIMALGQEPDYTVLGNLDREAALFAGGDLVTGPATVAEAIQAGRMAAGGIIATLEGLPFSGEERFDEEAVGFEDLNLETKINIRLQQRQDDPSAEADRCLGCGTCNSCGVCYLFCPDMAVDIIDGRYELNLDYCKGCGICVKECPAQAMSMEGGR